MKARAMLVPLPEGMSPDDDADAREGVVVVPAPDLPEKTTEGDRVIFRQRAWSVEPSSDCGDCHGRGMIRVHYTEPGEKGTQVADEPCGCVRLAIRRAEAEAKHGSGTSSAPVSVASRQAEQTARDRAAARRKRVLDEIERTEEALRDLERQRQSAMAPHLAMAADLDRHVEEQRTRVAVNRENLRRLMHDLDNYRADVEEAQRRLDECRALLAKYESLQPDGEQTLALSEANLTRLQGQADGLRQRAAAAGAANGIRHKADVARRRLADLRERLAALPEPETVPAEVTP